LPGSDNPEGPPLPFARRQINHPTDRDRNHADELDHKNEDENIQVRQRATIGQCGPGERSCKRKITQDLEPLTFFGIVIVTPYPLNQPLASPV
jgi:hypothetical protein